MDENQNLDLEIKRRNPLEKVSDALVKVGGWMGQQKHFSAIRDAFGAFLPLLIVGAMAVMINSVFISQDSLLASISGAEAPVSGAVYGNALYESWSNVSFYISPIFNGISTATLSLFAVYVSFLLGFFLTGSYGGNRLMGGLVSLAVFIIIGPIAAGQHYVSFDATNGVYAVTGNGMTFLGAQGIVFAMFAGLLAPMLLNKLQSIRALQIKMPEGVPPVIASSLNILFPFALTLLAFGLIQPVWGAFMILVGVVDKGAFQGGATDVTNTSGPGVDSLNDWQQAFTWYYAINAINRVIVIPFTNVGSSIYGVFIILFFIGFFWFFGVHGNNVMAPLVNLLWMPLTIQNVDLFAANPDILGADINNAFGELSTWTSSSMEVFTQMGGASSTLALLVGISIFSKIPEQKAVSRIAVSPSVFNISEPTLFGIPVVLNPVYFVPMALTEAILGVVTYLFVSWGIVNPIVVLVPWTTPLFLGGLLATAFDPWSLVLTAINFTIAFGMFTPFLLMDIRSQNKVKSDAMGITIEEYKMFAATQIEQDTAEAKAYKDVEKALYLEDRVESDLEATKAKHEKINLSRNEKLQDVEASREIFEHNIKVYEYKEQPEKAQLEKEKLAKLDSKVENINSKYEEKLAKQQVKIDQFEKELSKINNDELPVLRTEAKDNLEKELADIEVKRQKNQELKLLKTITIIENDIEKIVRKNDILNQKLIMESDAEIKAEITEMISTNEQTINELKNSKNEKNSELNDLRDEMKNN